MLRGYCVHCGFPATNKCNHCSATVCNNCLEAHGKLHETSVPKPVVIPDSKPEPAQIAPVSQAVKAEVKKPGRPRTVK